ncbi:MAG: hypothetical protein ACK5KR_02825 [Breznakia sp.]
MKKLSIGLCCSLFLLVGCSGSKISETVCSQTRGENKEMKDETIIAYDGDDVTSITYKTKVFTEKAVSDVGIDDLEAYAKDTKKALKDSADVKYTYEIKDKTFSDSLRVDITKDNIDDLKDKGLVNMYLGKDGELLKSKDMIKYIEDAGKKCK